MEVPPPRPRSASNRIEAASLAAAASVGARDEESAVAPPAPAAPPASATALPRPASHLLGLGAALPERSTSETVERQAPATPALVPGERGERQGAERPGAQPRRRRHSASPVPVGPAPRISRAIAAAGEGGDERLPEHSSELTPAAQRTSSAGAERGARRSLARRASKAIWQVVAKAHLVGRVEARACARVRPM